MIFRSPHPDVEIPEVDLPSFALRHAARLTTKPALIDGTTGRTLTYGELTDAVRRAAVGLSNHGVRKGDVFAIYAPSSLEYVIAFHAIASIGGIITPVNPAHTAEELAAQLRDADAKYLVTTPGLMAEATAAIQRFRIADPFVFGEAPGAVPFATLLQRDGPAPDVAIDPRTDIVVLPYSSGTTGLPKGVMLTHFNVVAMVSQLVGAGELEERDVLPGHLPFFHLFGIMVTLTGGLTVGATSVLMDRFEFAPFLRLMQDYRVTRAYVVPPTLIRLAKEPAVDAYDLSRLKTIACAAAPLGRDVAQACSRRLSCTVKQLYGMTEVGATHIAPDDLDPAKVASVGPCAPNSECRVVEVLTGREVGPGEEGELWVRTPAMMKGYLNRPETTAQTIDGDGWLHTGDIGHADAEGYFYVVDRLKELIKYKGGQVAPAELEAVLLAHPAIVDVAVIPSPDEEAGEVPKAFVVLKGEATADELMAFVAARVAPYKKVRRVEFVEAVPKSPSGKILRRLLVERERAALALPV